MKNQQVQLRAQVKIAEKNLAKAQEKEQLLCNKIRAALKAGDRSTAERLALVLDEARQDLQFAQQQVKMAKTLEAQGNQAAKKADRAIKKASALKPLIKAQDALTKALNKVRGDQGAGGTEDQIRKIEEDAALSEAKLDIALEDASYKSSSVEAQELMKDAGAEDLLRQIELDMGIEGRD